jgi:hypothetical protein
VLTTGLVSATLVTVAVLVRVTRTPAARALAILTIVTLPAMLFHNLSVGGLRWLYDNNPVIQVAWAAVALAAVHLAGAVSTRVSWAGVALVMVASGVVGFLGWQLSTNAFVSVQRSVVVWDDVPHLRGARMTTAAEPFHRLTRSVRTLAPDPDDAVLLLPSDPGLEAWFDRPRAALNAAIVFPDQYWASFVEDDLARIARDPPRVIIIGPIGMWALTSMYWAPGARQLVDRVRSEILPRFYRNVGSVRVVFGNGVPDSMTVYVRSFAPG